MANGQIAHLSRQEIQAAFDLRGDFLRRKHLYPSGRQLNAQGIAANYLADSGDLS